MSEFRTESDSMGEVQVIANDVAVSLCGAGVVS
jgi:hypothetical protein